MNLIELNDIILSKKKEHTDVYRVTDEDIELFQKVVFMEKSSKVLFEQVDDSNYFFGVYPDIKKIIGSNKCVECFYAIKLGRWMDGIPIKLQYILRKVFETYDRKYVNVGLNSAVGLLKNYASLSFDVDGEEYTIKDVIENVCNSTVKLLNSSVNKVQIGNVYEIYIPDAERVALIPYDIGSKLSYEDCDRLRFDIKTGITFRGIPIRTFGDRLGITKDDFDLRECI